MTVYSLMKLRNIFRYKEVVIIVVCKKSFLFENMGIRRFFQFRNTLGAGIPWRLAEINDEI